MTTPAPTVELIASLNNQLSEMSGMLCKVLAENAELRVAKSKQQTVPLDQVNMIAANRAVDILASLGVPPIEAERTSESDELNCGNSIQSISEAFKRETNPARRERLYNRLKRAWQEEERRGGR